MLLALLLLQARSEELVLLESQDSGKTVSMAGKVDIPRGACMVTHAWRRAQLTPAAVSVRACGRGCGPECAAVSNFRFYAGQVRHMESGEAALPHTLVRACVDP